MTKTFGYESILPTNTGVEAGETAVKLARLWGYKHKNVPENQAVVLFATNNFFSQESVKDNAVQNWKYNGDSTSRRGRPIGAGV